MEDLGCLDFRALQGLDNFRLFGPSDTIAAAVREAVHTWAGTARRHGGDSGDCPGEDSSPEASSGALYLVPHKLREVPLSLGLAPHGSPQGIVEPSPGAQMCM